MKECKLVQINDGNAETIQNGDWLLVREHPKAEIVIARYLNEGYSVKQMISVYDPRPIEDGIPFIKGGLLIYFERDI